jgi:flagellar hook-associated protein 3 FlgL
MRVPSETTVTSPLQRLSTPARASRRLSLRATLKAREQELRNAADAKGRLDLADSRLVDAMERLHRAGILSVRAAGAVDGIERDAIAREIAVIRDAVTSIANTVHRGRPLFAGFTEGPAVSNDGGTWRTLGDGQTVTRRVGEADSVPVNVTAAEVFWFGDDNVFALLDRLQAAIEADDGPAVSAELSGLTVAHDQVGASLARLDANAERVDSAQRRSQEAILAIQAEIAEVEELDSADAVMELQMQQVAYEATLQALGRALPPTLAAFLR